MIGRKPVSSHSRNKQIITARLLAGCLAVMLSAGPGFAQSAQSQQQQPVADDGNATGTAKLDQVKQHLYDSLSADSLANFNLFIYVDKAIDGSLAQRMYVFAKTDSGALALLHDWPVSTGREQRETDPHGQMQSTVTPRGFFELDPKRMYVDHTSSQWDEAMPYAMFFNWKRDGHDTGLAIHGTPEGNYDALGSRASAGCIRLSTENARSLFDLVQSQVRGLTPKLAYLDGDTEVSSEGLLLHDPDGRLQMADGYPVLVLVDAYAPEERVSSLY